MTIQNLIQNKTKWVFLHLKFKFNSTKTENLFFAPSYDYEKKLIHFSIIEFNKEYLSYIEKHFSVQPDDTLDIIKRKAERLYIPNKCTIVELNKKEEESHIIEGIKRYKLEKNLH